MATLYLWVEVMAIWCVHLSKLIQLYLYVNYLNKSDILKDFTCGKMSIVGGPLTSAKPDDKKETSTRMWGYSVVG